MKILQTLKDRARAHPQHIVLPEGSDPRTLEAAAKIVKEGFARVTVLGRVSERPPGVSFVDPAA
ncbi:MAG: phosphate acyltransferase, partial [Terriglobia bacterium]